MDRLRPAVVVVVLGWAAALVALVSGCEAPPVAVTPYADNCPTAPFKRGDIVLLRGIPGTEAVVLGRDSADPCFDLLVRTQAYERVNLGADYLQLKEIAK